MFSEKGHRVTVFTSDKRIQDIKTEELPEARVIRFNPAIAKADGFLGNETCISYAFALVVKMFIEKEGKPDLIESQDYNGIAYFLLQFKYCLYDWCRDVPVLVTMHSPNFLYMEYNELPLYKQPNYWIGEMERFSLQAADMLISPSNYLISELKKRGEMSNPNLQVLPNPYKAEKVNSSAASAAVVLNNALTFYGKLSSQKGTFKILEKFQSLWGKGFDKPFTMVGGQDIVFPPLGKTMGKIVREQYEQFIRSGLLRLKERIPPAERDALFSECMLFIVPSIVDNLPYVVLELMAQGKILIVSKQGGQAEIIDDRMDGFVFDYEVPGSFEQTLEKVVNLGEAERRQISAQAIKKMTTRYSYEQIYPAKMQLLEELKKKKTIPGRFPFIRTNVAEERAMEKPENTLLSVVVPFYNLGRYLPATVQSVLNSTYSELELIIVNDGSTEPQSLEALATYRGHQRIRIIDKKNTGLADTRNVGADEAKGGFLAFLDADDTVESTYYEKAISILNHYSNVHFVGAWTHYFDGSKNTWPTFNPEPPLILTHNTINSSSLVYKKNAYLLSGKNDPDFKIGLEDYESVVHMKAGGFNVVAIPELLFNYRVRKNSMIKKSDQRVRADYHHKISQKHQLLFTHFHKEVNHLNSYKPPLTFDNATLDDLPFQNVPLLAVLVRKAVPVIKSNSHLKNAVLLLKKIVKKQ
jgi:glycosyltransferase involved in cell wall biosynthesis